MRRVHRDKLPTPASLLSPSVLMAKAKLGEHYRLAAEERLRRRHPFDSEIWNASDVKEALSEVFFGKCAYCESRADTAEQAALIDHFRPLSNARNDKATASPDHYGWFAYEWRNLHMSCIACSRAKANIFPVEGRRAPNLCAWEEVRTMEVQLLIDPCEDEPSKHLSVMFSGELVASTELGIETISTLNLNRQELLNRRGAKLARCRAIIEAVHQSGGGQAESQLMRELASDSEFSGIALNYFLALIKEAATSVGLRAPRISAYERDIPSLIAALKDLQWLRPPEQIHRFAFERIPGSAMRSPVQSQPAEDSSWRLRASAQIKRIAIKNFKGLQHLTLDIPPPESSDGMPSCTMLLGENSTGKSSVLQAVALALMGSAQRKRLKLSPQQFLPREPRGWQYLGIHQAEVSIEFDAIDPVKLTIDPLNPQFIADAEGGMPLLAYGARRIFGKPLKRRAPVAKVRTLFESTAHLEYPGEWLKELPSSEFDVVARAMREVLSLQPNDSIGRNEDGQLFVRAHGRDSPLSQLSDGYKSLFAMVIDIMREMLEAWGNLESASGVVLIDELEVHLHPRWKMRIVGALRRAMPYVQFIATTHDPLCLRGLRDGEVHVLVRNEEDQIEQLRDLPDVRGMRAEQLLTSDFFGLSSTADADLEAGLESLAIAAATGEDLSIRIGRGEIAAMRWIGDSDVEQIVNEAIRRYLELRSSTPLKNRSKLRERTVNELVEALRTMKFDGP